MDREEERIHLRERLRNQEHGGSTENRLDISTGKKERSLTINGTMSGRGKLKAGLLSFTVGGHRSHLPAQFCPVGTKSNEGRY